MARLHPEGELCFNERKCRPQKGTEDTKGAEMSEVSFVHFVPLCGLFLFSLGKAPAV